MLFAEGYVNAMPKVIPFYGANDPAMFEIERRCMDRDGIVVGRIDELLPDGLVLDVGAGDGFTAQRLTRPGRTVIALEPAAGMIRRDRHLPWVQGAAPDLPFADRSMAGAYATWAFFFAGLPGVDAGLAALHRAVQASGPIVIADNAGNDEFLDLAPNPTAFASDHDWWRKRGFSVEIVHTAFRFDTLAEAQTLLGFYFGERGRANEKLVLSYNVAIYRREAR
jgi:SAM-dependent methyltransferase